MKRDALYIDGEWTAADSGKTIDVVNPATGAVIGTVPDAGAAETRKAILSAERAFESYSQTTAADRAAKLHKLHDLILDHQDDLARMLTEEQGKPLTEARAEIGMSAAYVRWFAGEARRVYGEIIPSPWQDRQLHATREPIGVVAAITPWNFPSSMLARKIAPALAAGCTVVAKPASQTPYSGLIWGQLCGAAGFPRGVVNVVTGDARTIGAELCSNQAVRKVTFTGSTQVGKILLRQAADTVKKVSMELGGNAPFIVFDDADLDAAVAGAIAAKFRNSGQTCVCTNRVYVQDGIHDAFMARFATAIEALKMGNGLEDDVQAGPLIDENSLAKVEEFVADAQAKGGNITLGGKRLRSRGFFFAPTLIENANDDMRLSREEVFGPLAPVFKFTSEEEVLRRANATEFGLAAYFYTQSLGRAMRVSRALEYGIVGINEGLVTTEVAPFGGFKESGVGREGGPHGIEDYLEIKYVCMGGLG